MFLLWPVESQQIIKKMQGQTFQFRQFPASVYDIAFESDMALQCRKYPRSLDIKFQDWIQNSLQDQDRVTAHRQVGRYFILVTQKLTVYLYALEQNQIKALCFFRPNNSMTQEPHAYVDHHLHVLDFSDNKVRLRVHSKNKDILLVFKSGQKWTVEQETRLEFFDAFFMNELNNNSIVVLHRNFSLIVYSREMVYVNTLTEIQIGVIIDYEIRQGKLATLIYLMSQFAIKRLFIIGNTTKGNILLDSSRAQHKLKSMSVSGQTMVVVFDMKIRDYAVEYQIKGDQLVLRRVISELRYIESSDIKSQIYMLIFDNQINLYLINEEAFTDGHTQRSLSLKSDQQILDAKIIQVNQTETDIYVMVYIVQPFQILISRVQVRGMWGACIAQKDMEVKVSSKGGYCGQSEIMQEDLRRCYKQARYFIKTISHLQLWKKQLLISVLVAAGIVLFTCLVCRTKAQMYQHLSELTELPEQPQLQIPNPQ